MKRLSLMCAAAVLMTATACAERWEVHINIPGSKPLVTVADVDFENSPILRVSTDWGDMYMVHFSNVVLVKRRIRPHSP